MAEAKRAYDFAKWFFGPPSTPQSPSIGAPAVTGAPPSASPPLPGGADQSAGFGAATGNPNIERQGARIRAIAPARGGPSLPPAPSSLDVDLATGLGAQALHSGLVRGYYYVPSVHALDPNDYASRAALKEAARRIDSPLMKRIIQEERPSTDRLPGTGGTANRTNPFVDDMARKFRIGGGALLGASVLADLYDIAHSPNPWRTASEAGFGLLGSTAGSYGGGILGGAGGSAVPFVGTGAGALAGTLAGSALGGHLGRRFGDWVYDSLAR